MIELRIDPEFKGKIPPLTQAEYEQLRENILEAGEVYEPIVTWNGIIVDGHNRWQIVQEHPEVKWKTREMQFADKWAAFDWMYKNQLGRRNLTEYQVTYIRGKLYEARKHTVTNERGVNQYTKVVKDQNDLQPKTTAEALGKELGVAAPTIKRSERFAKGIDAIREVSPETADKILNGELTPRKNAVMAVGKAEEDDRKAMIRQIEQGEPVKIDVPEKIGVELPKGYNGGGTAEYRERRDKIAKAVESLYNTEPVEYTLEHLLDEIKWNADAYIRVLTNTVSDHEELVKSNAEEVKRYIAENVTEKIKMIEEEI